MADRIFLFTIYVRLATLIFSFFSLETNSHVLILSFLFLQEVIYNLRVKYGAFMLTHRENVHFLPGDKPGNMYDFLLNLYIIVIEIVSSVLYEISSINDAS